MTGPRGPSSHFYPRPPRGGRPCLVICCVSVRDFYPRPPRGGRPDADLADLIFLDISIHALREEGDSQLVEISQPQCISIHALREEGDLLMVRLWQLMENFYPRPPRGGRPGRQWSWCRNRLYFYPRPPRGGRPLYCISATPRPSYFYPRPPRGGRLTVVCIFFHLTCISIHALREEGDSKNGEKHLRFCFIIKRSAQIWKSLSKNIRKNSCDLHRTA